jgi:hypothetical protein
MDQLRRRFSALTREENHFLIQSAMSRLRSAENGVVDEGLKETSTTQNVMSCMNSMGVFTTEELRAKFGPNAVTPSLLDAENAVRARHFAHILNKAAYRTCGTGVTSPHEGSTASSRAGSANANNNLNANGNANANVNANGNANPSGNGGHPSDNVFKSDPSRCTPKSTLDASVATHTHTHNTLMNIL